MSFLTAISIGIGGFIGAISRAYLNGLINKMHNLPLPLGTLGVNLLGSLIIGILFAYFESSQIPVHIKSLLTTGFLGALTTYSTFAFETMLLFQGGNILYAIVNMLLNVIGTVFFAWIGYNLFFTRM